MTVIPVQLIIWWVGCIVEVDDGILGVFVEEV